MKRDVLEELKAKLIIQIGPGYIRTDGISSQNIKKFMNSLEDGTMVLLEYPVYAHRNSTGGLRSSFVNITNLETDKALKLKIADVDSVFFMNIENFKEIE